MVLVKIIFVSNGIIDMSLFMPQSPSIGDDIEFPIDAVKYSNGAALDERVFKVKNVTWCIKEGTQQSYDKVEFSHVEIWVE